MASEPSYDYAIYALECEVRHSNPLGIEEKYMASLSNLRNGRWKEKREPLEYIPEIRINPNVGWGAIPSAPHHQVGDRNATIYHGLQYELTTHANSVVYVGATMNLTNRLHAQFNGNGALFTRYAPPTRVIDKEFLYGDYEDHFRHPYLRLEREMGTKHLCYEASEEGVHIDDIETYAFWRP